MPFTVSAGEEHVVAVAAAGATPFWVYLLVLSTVNEEIDLSAALIASDAPVAAATGAPAAGPAVTSAPATAPVAASTPSTAVPATPTYDGGVPTPTMSDVPSMVPTPGTGGGATSDVPSVIPTVDDELSPPSPPSSGGGEYQHHGAQLRRHHRQQLQYHHGKPSGLWRQQRFFPAESRQKSNLR
jgi:hypothetical protein